MIYRHRGELRSPTVVLMLAQRLRRWANIKTTVLQLVMSLCKMIDTTSPLHSDYDMLIRSSDFRR